jgi:hypothetical protein
MAAKKTGFDKFFDAQMRDPEFARGYRKARRETTRSTASCALSTRPASISG